MALVISDKVRHKLATRHGVSEEEILECFSNRARGYLIDDREDHQTDPPTHWFIAETDRGRLLKVVFVQCSDKLVIKTAYAPNDKEVWLYNKCAK